MAYRIQLDHETGDVICAGGKRMDKPEPQVECLARHKHNCDPLEVSRWVSDKEIQRMRQGKVTGMDEIDIQAVMVGQAAKKIRDYSKHIRVWELDTDK